ncbi:MAG: hypothetical protein AVDCRST_MAG66-246, partial [uncultured Pseudonocardia sp.]
VPVSLPVPVLRPAGDCPRVAAFARAGSGGPEDLLRPDLAEQRPRQADRRRRLRPGLRLLRAALAAAGRVHRERCVLGHVPGPARRVLPVGGAAQLRGLRHVPDHRRDRRRARPAVRGAHPGRGARHAAAHRADLADVSVLRRRAVPVDLPRRPAAAAAAGDRPDRSRVGARRAAGREVRRPLAVL